MCSLPTCMCLPSGGEPRDGDSGDEVADVSNQLATLLALFPFRPTTAHPAQLTPYLLLGSAEQAKNMQLMLSCKVTLILNCAEGETGTEHYHSLESNGVVCKGFSSSDARTYPMKSHFLEALEMVRTVRDQKDGVCFLHCLAGVNRSGFLAIGLLCELEKLPLVEAAALARSCRGRVCTNVGFQQQLLELAAARGWKLR